MEEKVQQTSVSKGERTDSFLNESLRISVTEGVFAQIFITLAFTGSIFILKFALVLNAAPLHLGILFAIGNATAIFQLFGIFISAKLTTLKPIVIKLSGISRFLILFLGILPFVFVSEYAIWIMLGILFVSTSIQMVSGNIWTEWIAASFPLRIRGRLFSIRQQYVMVAALLSGYVFSILADLFDENNAEKLITSIRNRIPYKEFFVSSNQRYFYLFLFVFAVAMGMISLKILAKQPEKKRHPLPIDLKALGTSLKDKNFRVLLLFSFWWMFATGIGSPFWQPFMINNLQMSLTHIQFYGMISSISSLLFLRFWGRYIDKWGNKNAMFYLIIFSVINPIIWLFTHKGNVWLLYIEAVTSGMMWCGAGIVTFNFALAVAPSHLRQLYTAFYAAVGGVATTITMYLSGRYFPEPRVLFGLHLGSEQVLFALTSLARLTALIPLYFVNEERSRPLLYSFSQLNQFLRVSVFRFTQRFFEKTKHNP
ncbi:MAG: MFS transporter [Candidatus Cloacimonadia bacterium]|jgi:MFS family permease